MDMTDIQSQMASLGMEMGEEDQIKSSDVDKIVREAMASVKADKKVPKEKGDVEVVHFDEGKSILQEGMKSIRLAVDSDGKGLLGNAALHYDTALIKFAKALENGVPTSEEARKKLVASMEGYMDRVQLILLASPVTSFGDVSSQVTTNTSVAYSDINKSRPQVLAAMNKNGFSCVSRAVQLRKKGKESEDTWTSFVLYSEAIDCFVTYMKNDAKGGSNESVKKAVFELLDTAESLKQKLS